MNMENQLEQVFPIQPEDHFVIYESTNKSKVVVIQGEMQEQLSKHDIQILLVGPQYRSNYNPSHAELFRDLHQKIHSDKLTASRLYEILQEIFRGKDPDKFTEELLKMEFDKEKFPADITVYLAQMLMIEQEINFGPGARDTNYDMPRDLLMSCIRWIYSEEYDNISEIISSARSGFAPYRYRWDGNQDEVWQWE